VLTLAAEGFLEPAAEAVVAAATRICQVLADSPAASDHRLLLATASLVLDGASNAAEPRLWGLRDLRGYALASVGRSLDAAAVYRALLADHTRLLGPDAPATLTTRNNLASWLARSGQVDAAVAEFPALRADRTRVLGPDAPDTLATRNNRARHVDAAGGQLRRFARPVRGRLRYHPAAGLRPCSRASNRSTRCSSTPRPRQPGGLPAAGAGDDPSAIRWDLIEQNYDQMIKLFATAILCGRRDSQRCTNILFILGTGVTAWLICAILIVLLESPSQKG
jgi:hypothetical protein